MSKGWGPPSEAREGGDPEDMRSGWEIKFLHQNRVLIFHTWKILNK